MSRTVDRARRSAPLPKPARKKVRAAPPSARSRRARADAAAAASPAVPPAAASAAAVAPADDAGALGERVQRLRTARRVTLDALAAGTGFSKGYLSRIENGKKTPPLGTLARVAAALGVEVTDLLGGTRAAGPRGAPFAGVVRAHQRPRVVRGASAFGYDYVSLAPADLPKQMEPFLFTFPREVDKYVFFEHEGEEFMYILSGRVEWQVGHQKHELAAGDAIYFDSRQPHRGRALDGEAVALVVFHGPARDVAS